MKARNVIILLSKNKFRILLICLLICIGYSIFFFSGLRTTTETDSIERVKSLPYAQWTPIDEKDIHKSGVTIHNPELSYKGINLFLSLKKPGAKLMDMHGNVVHTFLDKQDKRVLLSRVEPYRNNDFLVITKKAYLFMIDWDSNIKWAEKRMRFHHDMSVADNGDIYILTNEEKYSSMYSLSEPILENSLVILTKDGKVKKEISFAKMVIKNNELFNAAKKFSKREMKKDVWHVFHTNTVEVIDRDVLFGNNKLFKKGDILFCIRNLDVIGVMDIKKEEIIWYWGLDELDRPHQPVLLENGNILIFDNGYHRGYSRVIELNPITEEIEWEYKADPPESFFSKQRGSAQRFPNGNTLIAEANRGRVFEITRDGEIVWEFCSPEKNKKGTARAMIPRMMRIIDPENYPCLGRLE